MKLSPNLAHAIAVLLALAGAVLHFLQTNPQIASEVHITANAFLVAGFAIALASQTIFGTATPPSTDPLAGKMQGKSGSSGFALLRLVGALAVAGVLVALVTAPFAMARPSHGPVVVQSEGCGWLQSNAPQVASQTEQDLQCVLGQALAGNTNAGAIGQACGIAAVDQVAQDLASLWQYYMGGGGATPAIAAPQVCAPPTTAPPFKGAPACVASSSFAFLTKAAGK